MQQESAQEKETQETSPGPDMGSIEKLMEAWRRKYTSEMGNNGKGDKEATSE